MKYTTSYSTPLLLAWLLHITVSFSTSPKYHHHLLHHHTPRRALLSSRSASVCPMTRKRTLESALARGGSRDENGHDNNEKDNENGEARQVEKEDAGALSEPVKQSIQEDNIDPNLDDDIPDPVVGKLEELKQREAELLASLEAIRRDKLSAIKSRPLTIGIVGFGRFGQFIARTFTKYGRVVVTSRSDYSDVAAGMGAIYVPLDQPLDFFRENLDVIVFAVSILSFESTVEQLVPYIQQDLMMRSTSLSSVSIVNGITPSEVKGPLIVDVLSVKEHARNVLLERLPVECDILCTHPMFGPDSGRDGWQNLNFVYEKTRINKILLDREASVSSRTRNPDLVEGMDRMERFLSIWEEEGCNMVQMTCHEHDTYAANSQFITHLVGRVLGSQGLSPTPIDTSGFKSVLKLIDSTTADSFELFYGLYKYNQKNSLEIIKQLRSAMDDVENRLQVKETEEQKGKSSESITDVMTTPDTPESGG